MSEIGLIISVTNYKTQSMPVGNVPSERLKIMLNEISELLNLVAQTVEHYCELSLFAFISSKSSDKPSKIPSKEP